MQLNNLSYSNPLSSDAYQRNFLEPTELIESESEESTQSTKSTLKDSELEHSELDTSQDDPNTSSPLSESDSRKNKFKALVESAFDSGIKKFSSKYEINVPEMSKESEKKWRDLKERTKSLLLTTHSQMVDQNQSDLQFIREIKKKKNSVYQSVKDVGKELQLQRKANRNGKPIMTEQKTQVIMKALELNANLKLNQAEKGLEAFEKGRNFLELHLQAAEFLKKEPSSLTEEDLTAYQKNLSDNADELYHSFSQECKKELEEAVPQKTLQKKPKKKTQNPAKPSDTNKENISPPSESAAPQYSLIDLRSRKAVELLHRRPCFKLHKRVNQRWATKNLDELRRIGPSYAALDDETLSLERAKHFCPGLEKLIARKEERDIYTFPTDRGLGMLCEMEYRGARIRGIIYYGIDSDTQTIFHRYLVPNLLDFGKMNDIFHDPVKPEATESEGQWKLVGGHTFQFSEKGVVSLTYENEDHSLRVFPLRRDLLDPKLFSS